MAILNVDKNRRHVGEKRMFPSRTISTLGVPRPDISPACFWRPRTFPLGLEGDTEYTIYE